MGNCECGYSGEITSYCPLCGRPKKSATGDKTLIEHGWRDSNGDFKVVIRNGRFYSRDIDTEYSFTRPIRNGFISYMDSIQKIPHQDEEFIVYLNEEFYKKDNKNEFGIAKLWYGSGTLHMDLYSFETSSQSTIDLLMDDTVSVTSAEPDEPVGWTCPGCGKKYCTDRFCENCGTKIEQVELFYGYRYMTSCPPQTESFCVYEFSDTQLILETFKDGKTRRRYISKDVIEPAYEIIRKNGIDKWKEYENNTSQICGGTVSVRYRDGDEMVGSTLDKMGGAVVGAYYELFALFSK